MVLYLKGRRSATQGPLGWWHLAARGAPISVASAVGFGTYVAALALHSAAIRSESPPFSWPALLAGLLMYAVVLSGPVARRVRRYVGDRLPGARGDSRRASRILNTYARDITDLDTLALAVEHAITVATGAADVRLLVPAAKGTWFVPVSRRVYSGTRSFQLPSAGAIVTWLRFHDDPLRREELRNEPWYLPLSGREESELERCRVSVLVPVKLREQLVGIVALAPRPSGDPYTQNDLRALSGVSKQMAAWVAHALGLATSAAQRARLEQLLDRAVRAQDDERKRLAVELHDSPVQWLTSAVYHVEACLESFRRGDRDRIAGELEQIRGRLDRTLQELRQTATALHPPELEHVGLVKALDRYTALFERDTGLPTGFQAREDVPRLPASLELAVYRVVQEALANVRKHSRATEAEVRVGLHNGALWAVVRDNGVGFDADADFLAEGGHLGLATMEERAHTLGGTLGIQSGTDGGTQITLLIPYMQASEPSSGAWDYIPEREAEPITGPR